MCWHEVSCWGWGIPRSSHSVSALGNELIYHLIEMSLHTSGQVVVRGGTKTGWDGPGAL